ncbi:MAG: GNAT family N-acetyltransferase [Clostridia bacterium]|nr:GNAT family N-acetyltransferase [Clostridia bacterium]
MNYHKTLPLPNGHSCVIRSGRAEDAPGVLRNFVLTHGETDFLTTYPDEIHFTLEQEQDYLRTKAESPREIELVAEVDGEIAGTAGVDSLRAAEKTRHRASFGISIAKAWWGLGIGRALTEACIECARAAGYLQLELEVVADNARALALYRRAGFVEYGRNPRGFRTRQGQWQENVLMRLDLEESGDE